MKFFCPLILSALLAVAPAWSQEPAVDGREAALLEEIHEMLVEHPRLIPDLHAMLAGFIAEEAGRERAMESHREWLFEDPAHPRFGPADSERTIVVFTDYNCPYCKRLEPELQALMKKYPDLAVVNIFVPLRQDGVPGLKTGSARMALQVWREQPESFPAVHDLLLKKTGMHTGKSLEQVAAKTGTSAFMEEDADADAVIARNMSAFHALGLRGTPSLLVGDLVIPGYVSLEQLESAVELQFAE